MSELIHVGGIVSISCVIAVGYCIDIFFSEKKAWFFTRSIAWLVPAIFAKNIIGETNRDLFYISLSLSFLVFAIVTKIWCRLFLKKETDKLFTGDTFTYFDLLQKGYPKFKAEIKSSIDKKSTSEKKGEKNFINLNKELKHSLPKFIAKIYSVLEGESDARAYCFAVMQDFVNNFLSSTDARFTIREYDGNNTMRAIWSTDQDKIPGEIPLDRKNMITRAIELDSPAVYSKNKSFHVRGNGNLENGLYIDYVTVCLLKSEQGKPLFSVCLDVKDEKSRNRLLALVDSNILQIISLAMSLKLQKAISIKEE